MNNQFRAALLERRLTLGTWIQIGHPACAEILARAGFDWVCVDFEHGVIDLETAANIFRALNGSGCVPVARLPGNDPIWIHRVLDAGARGLIVPMIKTAAEARAAVREAKYPPRGARGFGYARANLYGADFHTAIASANDEIAMVMQIEHRDAMAELDAILAVEGVDGLFIGPLDLSGSMGLTGQLEHPQMLAALDRFRAACRAHAKAAGLHLIRPDAEAIRRAIDAGYTLLALGLDTVFMDQSARAALRAAGRTAA
ncbi:MAG: aldolase/citrate lyase family protein [Verrucomicrobiae bacterium]|nr:aldolase/citrate lyase family protein [Verrucomicrobiae bacterium]MDW8309754.1 aldolase/citrate lyase family protein [Verrucomicrobiales bacterium]